MSAVHAGGRATDDTPETAVLIMEQVPLTGLQELSAGLVLPQSLLTPCTKCRSRNPCLDLGGLWVEQGQRPPAEKSPCLPVSLLTFIVQTPEASRTSRLDLCKYESSRVGHLLPKCPQFSLSTKWTPTCPYTLRLSPVLQDLPFSLLSSPLPLPMMPLTSLLLNP